MATESDIDTSEVEALRERVARLERELADTQARANAAVARAEERLYWLDRWNVDLNALMRRRGASELRALLRGLRWFVRFYRRLKKSMRDTGPGAPVSGGEPAAEAPPLAFARDVVPDELKTSHVTDLLHGRLPDGVEAEVESRLGPEERAQWNASHGVERRRLTLHLGVHHGVEQVLERTGLTAAAPPEEVHAMGRGPLAAGGASYYADLIADAARLARMDIGAIGSALDFGCSSGRAVRVLAAAYPDVAWHGCDPNREAIEWARENLPGIDFSVSPQDPPLEFEDGKFDLVFAISIWSHFAEEPALAWLEEMRRIVRPGGVLVVTTHGYRTMALDEEGGRRTPELLSEIAGSLYERGFWYRAEFGERGDWGVKDPGWGSAFLTPEWLLSHTTADWRLAGFAPGRVERNQDLYVLERR